MATRKTTKKTSGSRSTTSRSRATQTPTQSQRAKVTDYFKFGESYTSLILGIVVVIIAAILLISFVRNRDAIDILTTDTPDISSTNIGPGSESDDRASTHTVAEGEDLWTIAETHYDSGYNWVDIQEANNISNPDQIAAGMELTLPDVEPKLATVETEVQETPEQSVPEDQRITGSQYTIVQGDTLWSIAVRRYNDGYQYMRIAEANNLSNPNIILAGNTLKLP